MSSSPRMFAAAASIDRCLCASSVITCCDQGSGLRLEGQFDQGSGLRVVTMPDTQQYPICWLLLRIWSHFDVEELVPRMFAAAASMDRCLCASSVITYL